MAGLNEIYALADRLAPKALSDEMCAKYGWYDNSGVLVNTGEEICGIVCSLDLSEGAIDAAIKAGANLMITHHPAIYGKISTIDCDGTILGKKLVRCIRAGISVIAMHLNLDAAPLGVDESLMQGVALSAGCEAKNIALWLSLQGGGYGRAYDLNGVELSTLAENTKKTFQTERVLVYGEGQVNRIASFCGSGADEGAIAFALAQGADTLLSADFKHHILALAMESGLKVISLTHYASEQYGFEKYYEKISRETDIPCIYHVDDRLL